MQRTLMGCKGAAWLPGTIATPEPDFVPGARVYNNANISVTPGVHFPLTFNSERFDNDNIHSVSTNTTRLTAQTPGKYLITGNVTWSTANAGTFLFVRLNGSTLITSMNTVSIGSPTQYIQSVSTFYHLNAGDYVELAVYTGISDMSIIYVDDYTPDFGMIWLGP